MFAILFLPNQTKYLQVQLMKGKGRMAEWKVYNMPPKNVILTQTRSLTSLSVSKHRLGLRRPLSASSIAVTI